MKRLSLEELKSKAQEIATKESLNQITGGTLNDCHDLATDDTVITTDPVIKLGKPAGQ